MISLQAEEEDALIVLQTEGDDTLVVFVTEPTVRVSIDTSGTKPSDPIDSNFDPGDLSARLLNGLTLDGGVIVTLPGTGDPNTTPGTDFDPGNLSEKLLDGLLF